MKTKNRKKTGGRSKGNGHGRLSLARNLNDLSSSAQGALRSGRQAMGSAYRMASGLSRSLPSARDMLPGAPRNLQTMVDNNPLIIGVIGIGVGLLLGAMMPIGAGRADGSSSPRRLSPAAKNSRPRRSTKSSRRAPRRTKAAKAAEQSGKAAAATGG